MQRSTTSPNTAMEISAHLTKLAMHYWRPDFTPGQMRHLMADYLEDLRGHSPAEIADACARYRRNPENKFYPRSGQLLELMKIEPWCRLQTYHAPPALPAPRKTKSVGDVLREHGFVRQADRWEAKSQA